jgi:hypothetical protein
MITGVVICANGLLPAAAITCLKIFSRCLRVASASALLHAPVSR